MRLKVVIRPDAPTIIVKMLPPIRYRFLCKSNSKHTTPIRKVVNDAIVLSIKPTVELINLVPVSYTLFALLFIIRSLN